MREKSRKLVPNRLTRLGNANEGKGGRNSMEHITIVLLEVFDVRFFFLKLSR